MSVYLHNIPGDAETMNIVAEECRELSQRYGWKYPGTRDYFAGILGAECSRQLVFYAASERSADQDDYASNFIRAWCEQQLENSPDPGLYKRITSVADTLHSIENTASEVQSSRFRSKQLVDLEYSGDLHDNSVSACLIFEGSERYFLKLNGYGNYQFVDNVRAFLQEKSGLSADNWFHLPPFTEVSGHLVTCDVRSGKEESEAVDIENWYKQAGTLLAFSALVGLTDLHVENILTSSNKLFLIDVDTLLHPRIRSPHFPNKAMEEVDSQIFFSILGSGLLPFGVSRDNGDGRTIDIAGLTATEKASAVMSLVKEEDASGKQLWRLQSTPLPAEKSLNVPTGVEDGKQSLRDHANSIVEAFSAVIEGAREHLDELKTLLWSESRKVTVRCLVRNTASYSLLLNLASSPIEESRNRVGQALLRHSSNLDERIVQEEVTQLEQGYIPVFWWNAHEEPFGLQETPINILCKRITDDWLTLQKQLLEFFLTEKKAMTVGGDSFSRILKSENISTDRISFLIDDLINNLVSDAHFTEDETVNYASLTVDGADELAAVAMGDDVYSGLAGVLFACREISRIENCVVPPWFILSLEKSLAGFQNQSKFRGYYESSVHQLSEAYKEPGILDSIPHEQTGDFIGGLAGSIAFFPTGETVAFSGKALVEKLIDALREGPGDSLCWVGEGGKSFASFAHGNSGIIYALSRWLRKTGSDTYVERTINQLLLYEFQCLPQAQKGIYIDSRSDSTPSPNWCHSISGMLLTRIEVLSNDLLCQGLPRVTVERLQSEVKNQIAWLDKNWGDTFSYGNCHGVAGNLAILKWASVSTSIPIKTDIAQNFTNLLHWGEKSRWGNTVGGPISNPSLMNGLWGVVYSAVYACLSACSNPPFWAIAEYGV